MDRDDRAEARSSSLSGTLSRMKILHVVGARPNFPKVAPVYRAAKAAGKAAEHCKHTDVMLCIVIMSLRF